eukprot:TRINITY_DN12128_c0_g1_i1.p1 TRINITY_DN12128_c0_g1~~TRINITY_DN12128_c0_g1_i1.p1  ORF type:complete len:231 (+),score=38.98 TRINITY_DN12128_c0_g1_i1:23-715(+)
MEANSDIDIKVIGTSLSIVGCDSLTTIPADLGEKYGDSITELTIQFTQLTHVSNLSRFTKLTSLVLDNNELGDDNEFPCAPQLQTLWLNHNNITRVENLLDIIANNYPNLTYLSLLKNPCCPNFLVGKSSTDYQKYRRNVIGRLPSLKFLDATAVSNEEREEAAKLMQGIARMPTEEYRKVAEGYAVSEEKGLDKIETNIVEENAAFGKTKYIYVGRHSEGNRFIRDTNL